MGRFRLSSRHYATSVLLVKSKAPKLRGRTIRPEEIAKTPRRWESCPFWFLGVLAFSFRRSGDADDRAVGQQIDLARVRRFGQAGHGQDLSGQRHQEAGPGRQAKLAHGHLEFAWPADQ